MTRDEMREAGIAAGIPADVVDKMLDRGMVPLENPFRRIMLRAVADETEGDLLLDPDLFKPTPAGDSARSALLDHDTPRRYVFNDRGFICALVIPEGGRLAGHPKIGIEHPGCPMLADLALELDAFYCTRCTVNGRVSGAWCVAMVGAS